MDKDQIISQAEGALSGVANSKIGQGVKEFLTVRETKRIEAFLKEQRALVRAQIVKPFAMIEALISQSFKENLEIVRHNKTNDPNYKVGNPVLFANVITNAKSVTLTVCNVDFDSDFKDTKDAPFNPDDIYNDFKIDLLEMMDPDIDNGAQMLDWNIDEEGNFSLNNQDKSFTPEQAFEYTKEWLKEHFPETSSSLLLKLENQGVKNALSVSQGNAAMLAQLNTNGISPSSMPQGQRDKFRL